MESTTSIGAAEFDTALGTCALAWRDEALTRFALPGRDALASIRDGLPVHPLTPVMAEVVERVRAHLDGDLDDLRSVAIDLTGLPDFPRRVLEFTRTIAPGHTLGYGQVAERIGAPGAAQAVGQALGRNPIPLVVPCHRVLAADHSLHGFSAPGGITTKQRLLTIERTPGFGEPTLF